MNLEPTVEIQNSGLFFSANFAKIAVIWVLKIADFWTFYYFKMSKFAISESVIWDFN